MRKDKMNSEQLEKKYKTDIKSAQGTIAMAAVITLIYIIRLFFTRAFDFYFCISFIEFLLKTAEFSPGYHGSVPTALAVTGVLLCVGIYTTAVILAQKKPELLWISLLLYSIDTAFLLVIDLTGYFAKFTQECFIDIVFHVFVLVFLVVGVVAVKKLKNLKAEN